MDLVTNQKDSIQSRNQSSGSVFNLKISLDAKKIVETTLQKIITCQNGIALENYCHKGITICLFSVPELNGNLNLLPCGRTG